MDAHTVLVVRSGIGDSIDTVNLLTSYYENRRCEYFEKRFLGVVFNVKKQSESALYGIESVSAKVRKYFESERERVKVLGWIPSLDRDGVKGPERVCLMEQKAEAIRWKEWPLLTESEMRWVEQ